jgi:hypothetical protein
MDTTQTPRLRKTRHQLPSDVAANFARFDTSDRDRYIYALREARWTLQSVSEASGLTRERVRQIHRDVAADGRTEPLEGISIPTPPTFEQKPKRQSLEPDPQTLARMRELRPIVERYRAGSSLKPQRDEYNRLLLEAVGQGVTVYRLSKLLGPTHAALRTRIKKTAEERDAERAQAFEELRALSTELGEE